MALLSPVTAVIAEDSNAKTETTDSAGTTVNTEHSHSESTGWMGSKKSETDEKVAVDPKGLMNKKTTEGHEEHVAKKNGDYSDSAEVKHADGTVEMDSGEKTTSNHWTDKGKTTTTTREHTVDPKGLMNKQHVQVQEKVVDNGDGTKSKTVTKKVNGDTVSEHTEGK